MAQKANSIASDSLWRIASTAISNSEARRTHPGSDPHALLALAWSHWSIENVQHYRRDRTQNEDRCPVSDSTTARNLSLFRSLAIFLFLQQSKVPGGKKSLPDFVTRRGAAQSRQRPDLERDQAIQANLASPIDHSQAALPDPLEQFVG